MGIIELFRKGIFLLHTARFGKVAEIMIKRKYNLSKPIQKTTKYDLWDGVNNQRVEVKFSTVREKDAETITESTIIEKCITAKWQNTPIKYADRNVKKFDRNIEQVKIQEFDILYYGLFFSDNILIFRVGSDMIKTMPTWSSKMHRGKANTYIEGQFHITNKNVQYHIENHLVDRLTYKQLYKLVTPYDSTFVLLCALSKEIKKLWKH